MEGVIKKQYNVIEHIYTKRLLVIILLLIIT